MPTDQVASSSRGYALPAEHAPARSYGRARGSLRIRLAQAAALAMLLGQISARAQSPALGHFPPAAVTVPATDPALPPLLLAQLIDEVLAHSPALQAKQAEVRAASERPAQLRTLDDPMLMVELWQVPVGAAHIPLMFSLRQPLTWPGKLSARAALVAHEAPRAQAELATTAKSLRLAAARGYFDYRLAVRSLAVLSSARALSATLIAAVDVRYRVGRAELAELLSAQEIQVTLDNLLLDAGRERDLTVAALNVLRSQPTAALLGPPTTAPPLRAVPPLASLVSAALRSRPELLSIDHQIAQANARSLAAAQERAPDLALSFSYMATLHPGAAIEHNFTAGLQSSLPSFSLARAAAQGREALAMRQGLLAQRRQLEQEIAGQLQAVLLRTETAQRHMHLHAQSLLPLAERSLRAAQAGYQSGRVPLSLLLETARRLFEHQLDFERYQAELGQRLAELEAESGLPLLTSPTFESGPAAEGAKR